MAPSARRYQTNATRAGHEHDAADGGAHDRGEPVARGEIAERGRGYGGPGEEEGTQAAEDEQVAKGRGDAGERDDPRAGQQHVPDQVAGGVGVVGLAHRATVREQARQRDQRHDQADHRQRGADREPREALVAGAPGGRVEHVAHQRGTDDAEREARGDGCTGFAVPARQGNERGHHGHDRARTQKPQSHGNGWAGCEQWGHVGLTGVHVGRKAQTPGGVQTCGEVATDQTDL